LPGSLSVYGRRRKVNVIGNGCQFLGERRARPPLALLKEYGLDFVTLILDTHADFLEISIKMQIVKTGKVVDENEFQSRGDLHALADKIEEPRKLDFWMRLPARMRHRSAKYETNSLT